MQDLLLIDSFADSCNVTFLTDLGAGEVYECSDHGTRAHARQLAVFTEEIFRESARMPRGIVVIAGPGSYTGLRIGVSTAKGLAWSMDIPLFAVSSLLYVAQQFAAPEAPSKDPLTVFSVLQARSSEVFAAEFKLLAGQLSRIAVDQAWSTPLLRDRIAQETEPYVVVAPFSTKKDEVDNLGFDVVRVKPALKTLSPLLANQLNTYRVQDLNSFEPAYLKEFVARKAAKSVFEKLMF